MQIAFLKGPKAEIDLTPLMRKRLTFTGSTLRNRPVAFKAEIARELSENVLPLLEDGRVKPQIDAIYRLEEAAKRTRTWTTTTSARSS